MTTISKDLLHALLEYRDGKLFWRVTTGSRAQAGNRAGCLANNGYRYIKINDKAYLEHRLIFLMHHGELPECLDHINGVKNDNRIENLRPASLSQNQHNAKTSSNNTSGIKGVCFHKDTQKWMARVKIGGKSKHLGLFTDLAEAEAVIRQARESLHGEFANHGGEQ